MNLRDNYWGWVEAVRVRGEKIQAYIKKLSQI